MEHWQSFFLEDWARSTHETELPEDALVLLHSVAVHPCEVVSNFKMRVDVDGRVFVARHSGAETGLPVDASFPAEPSRTLDAATLAGLRQALRDDRFAMLEAVVGDPDVEDGWYDAIFARTDQGPRFVISRHASLRILDALAKIRGPS